MTQYKKSRISLTIFMAALSCFMLMAMGRCGGDGGADKGGVPPSESQAHNCGEYLIAKTCTKTKAGKLCEWKDDTCQEKAAVIPGECEKKSDKDECQNNDNCLWKDDKCSDADPKEAGTCAAIKVETICNGHESTKHKRKCSWDTGTSQCREINTKKVTVKSFNKVAAAALPSPQVDRVVLSRDGENAYFISNGSTTLSICNIQSPANFATRMADVTGPDAWTPDLSLSPGTAQPHSFKDEVGKAKLAGSKKILRMNPTEKGVVLTVGGLGVKNPGVSYLEGKLYKAAWANDNGKRDVIKLGSDNEEAYFGGVLRKADKSEYLYIFSHLQNNQYHGATGGPIYAPTGANPNVKIAFKVDRDYPHFRGYPFTASGLGSDNVNRGFLVDVNGITVVRDDQIGVQVNDFPHVARADSLGSDKWKVKTKASPNEVINVLLMHQGKLYIALGGGIAGTGGVAIFNPVDNTTTSPDARWSGKAVRDLTVDASGAIWAVLEDGLGPLDPNTGVLDTAKLINKAAIDGAQFTNDYATEVDNTIKYSGTLAKFNKLTSAQWFGEQLIITTANEGAYYISAKEEVLLP